MRKYALLFLTLLLLSLTVAAYALENKNPAPPELKPPALNLTSPKYGQIKNIVWVDNFVNSDKALLFLATQDKDGTAYSALYYFNVDSGETLLLGEYLAHPYLDQVILFDNPFVGDGIITASAQGIVKTTLQQDNNGMFNPLQEFTVIDGFEQVTSFDDKGTVFYTKADDLLLYAKTLPQVHYNGLMVTDNTQPTETAFFRKPRAIINANTQNRILTYTSLENGRYNLYCMGFNGSPVTKFNLPLVKNVISAQAVEDSYGFIGFKDDLNFGSGAGSNPKGLNLFMCRKYPAESSDVVILDTIPYYTDRFGAVPALASTTFNADYTVVYTIYDQNHHGKIKICRDDQEPQTILADENIFGPVRIATKDIGDTRQTPLILYFSQEKNQVKIKICDLQGKLVKDITDTLL